MPFFARAFRYRNYRLFFAGQFVSLVGTWMTNVAVSWLVYRLTGSTVKLGLVGFAGQLPAFLLSPIAGIFVDRWNNHRLLILTQVLLMLQALALAALTLTGHVTFHWLLALSAVQGLINAFDMPCRQSFVVHIIEDKQDLGNAIALNSSMFNAARLVGPSIGGLIIAAAGEGWCFLIDGISFLAVLAALLAMAVLPQARNERGTGAWEELREGLAYAYHSPPIRSILLLMALVSLVGVPYAVLLPAFADKTLHGGPHTLGFLMASSGCGAVAGGLWLASRKSVLGLSRLIPAATAVFGLTLAAFAITREAWLSMALMAASGAGFMVQIAASNTILQTIVDDDKRGRVMSFFMMAFLGTAPFGSLLAGVLADRMGTPATLLAGGLCCAAGAVWFARELPRLRKAIRPIYVRLGILPPLPA